MWLKLSADPPPETGHDWGPGTEIAFGELYRPHDAHWPRLVRGQRIATSGREWRVTDVVTGPDGDEAYTLEPAEVVDARIEAARMPP